MATKSMWSGRTSSPLASQSSSTKRWKMSYLHHLHHCRIHQISDRSRRTHHCQISCNWCSCRIHRHRRRRRLLTVAMLYVGFDVGFVGASSKSSTKVGAGTVAIRQLALSTKAHSQHKDADMLSRWMGLVKTKRAYDALKLGVWQDPPSTARGCT